ncbi:MAG: hypothetical protein EAX95_15205 [Candidatus Thorarchaeota archaeon]|nr:hypothetical protein [Candidatus Thorarchaeota archaeon]
MQSLYEVLVDLILQGHLGLFIACLGINLIPFISPSNMVLAGIAALLLPSMSWVEIGVVVALSATLSKLILYYSVRGSRAIMSESMLLKIEYERKRVDRWGALALVLSAASPVPDDPIVIYTGLTKYNVWKFLVSYYLGKVAVTLPGAFLGYTVGALFESIPLVIASIVLTAILTGFIFKRRTEHETPTSIA